MVLSQTVVISLGRDNFKDARKAKRQHMRWSMVFIQSKPLITLATGYTESESNIERELDLSEFAYEANENQNVWIGDETEDGPAEIQQPSVASSSAAQLRAVQPNEGILDDRRSLDVYSSLDSAVHDDECETVKGLSDDGHSYAGTVVRGALRGDSE